MLKRCILSLAMAFLVVSSSPAQQPAPRRAAPAPATLSQWEVAYYAWVAGNYPDALQRAERILSAPNALDFRDSIALMTGELYLTQEVARDGNSLRWSSDSRAAAYLEGTGAARRLHLVDVSGAAPREIAAFAGLGLVFSPTRNEAAYFAISETPALKTARAKLDSMTAAGGGGGGFGGPAGQLRTEIARLEAEASHAVVRDLASGQERDMSSTGVSGLALRYGRDGTLYLMGATTPGGPVDIYALGASAPRAITDGPGAKNFVGASATHVVYTTTTPTPNWVNIVVRKMGTTEVQLFNGRGPVISNDGSTLAFVSAVVGDTTLNVVTLANGASAIVRQGPWGLGGLTLSADGKQVAYQVMWREDWEIAMVGADGKDSARITRDPQDDYFPQYLANGRLLGLKGEARHRRSYTYDIATHAQTRLFHNNTVRTVSPEYEWAVSPDGGKVLIVADRDGNTISPERGVYLTDLSTKVSVAQTLERVRAQAATEKELRGRGTQMFAAIAARVKPVVADVSADRIYTYSKALMDMDSRNIAKPGNQVAVAYFVAVLKTWGYEPEVQWFEPRPGVRTANVVATLKGTKYPERIHVMSAHFDSVERTAGSDDDGTGTTALLEAARVMVGHPQPATVQFAFLTGEESGSLGAREFVRVAKSRNEQIVGVLNNDMGGWVEDGRLDDTIRYSSPYVRDIQHSAAFLFTRLITYDARYYRGTDAGTFYDAFGEITAGIGGYPILASPHYHETHDVVETINPQIIAEIAKVSIASIMLMAQQPELPKPTM
ncbi:MAG: M20/M25/M40 family metallo-hydrolase [Gemmatimonadetes bacterium]|nr:M20/M25/M40 family metallo-hydrolase [Gemmatimonadota bacterium]